MSMACRYKTEKKINYKSKLCPLIGNYVINNYLPDFSKLPTALMQSGDYMLECKFFDKDGKFLNGIQTYGQLIAIAGGK